MSSLMWRSPLINSFDDVSVLITLFLHLPPVMNTKIIILLQAYNDHEHATNVLLHHGGDVTLTDDRGLMPVDLARSRKMKNTLKEAWNEKKQKQPVANLAPVRAPSREDTRNSVEEKSRRRKGEVIFDVRFDLRLFTFTDYKNSQTITKCYKT